MNSLRNQFRRFGLPSRRLRTSYIKSGARSKGNSRSITVQNKADEIRNDYAVSQGKGNGYSQTKGGNAAFRKKTFNIGGKITITEKTEGVSGEGSYNKNENAAKSKTRSVTYYASAQDRCGAGGSYGGSHGGRGSYRSRKSGKCRKDNTCKEFHFGASLATPELGASLATPEPTAQGAEVAASPTL